MPVTTLSLDVIVAIIFGTLQLAVDIFALRQQRREHLHSRSMFLPVARVLCSGLG